MVGLVDSVLVRARSSVTDYLMRRTGGVDLTRVDRVPERLTWPLTRTAFDPLPRLDALRDREPVSRLTSFLGITVVERQSENPVRNCSRCLLPRTL